MVDLTSRLKIAVGPGLFIFLFIVFAGVIPIIVSEYRFNGKYDYMIASLVTVIMAGAVVYQSYYTRKELEYRKVESFKDEIIVSILSLLKLTDFMDIILDRAKANSKHETDLGRELIEICSRQCDENLSHFIGCDGPLGLLSKYSKRTYGYNDVMESRKRLIEVAILPKPEDAVKALFKFADLTHSKSLREYSESIRSKLPEECPKPEENESLNEYWIRLDKLKASLLNDIIHIINEINKKFGFMLSHEILKQSCLKCCYLIEDNRKIMYCR